MVVNCQGFGGVLVKYGLLILLVFGYDIQVFDVEGQLCVVNEIGLIVVKLLFFLGCFFIFWNNVEGFCSFYFEDFLGYYLMGDVGFVDVDGYVYIMSCIDDLINVVGYWFFIGGMEEVFVEYFDVVEVVVVGVYDVFKGQLFFGFVVLNVGMMIFYDCFVGEFIVSVCEVIGLVVVFKVVVVVEWLLKICLGKVLCGIMCVIVDGVEFKVLVMIDDFVIFDEIVIVFEIFGYLCVVVLQFVKCLRMLVIFLLVSRIGLLICRSCIYCFVSDLIFVVSFMVVLRFGLMVSIL